MNLPSLDQIKDIIGKTESAIAAFTGSNSTVAGEIASTASLAGSVADIFFPGASIAGLGVSKIISAAGNLASSRPDTDLVNAYNEVKAAATGGAAPTDAQWSAFNAAADKAHADFQTAVKAYAGS